MYEIKTIQTSAAIEDGNTGSIAVYNWGGGYRPAAFFKLCFMEGKGFLAKLWCLEENPRAVYTENGAPVYKDSCLEFFADFLPEKKKGYLNFEANANGAMITEFGTEGSGRIPLTKFLVPYPEIKPFREKDTWGYMLFVPLSLIEAVYGSAEIHAGSRIQGNFFKCGDDTEKPHYGSYTQIDWSTPSFHHPEFFADMPILPINN